MQANSLGSPFQYLSTSTAGIIFLGTPHRGTEASKWGELIAVCGRRLRLSTEDSILKDLRKDSNALSDLLYSFSLWLSRFSVDIVCFFEQHRTDYGKRYGISWREMVSNHVQIYTSILYVYCKVVDERSACIDGHEKVPLPTDHLKINKFEGPNDICYKTVTPIMANMARQAHERIQTRLHRR